MRRWDTEVSKYLRVCEIRGLAKETIENRARELGRWGLWQKRNGKNKQLENISREDIIHYVKNRGAFKAKATIYGILSNLRGMGNHLVTEGLWHQNPLKWINGPRMDPRRYMPRRIQRKHLQGLIIAMSQEGNYFSCSQNLTILTILYGTGIRRGELSRLKVSDWDRSSGSLRIDNTKSNKERLIPVPQITRQSIESYLPVRYNKLEQKSVPDPGNLFISNRGTPLGGEQISRRIKRICEQAGLPRITLHQFRHSCASDLLEAGIGLREIQQVLGHADISTTYRYVRVADPERHKAIARHPINSILSLAEGGPHE
jgi:integrase/recombinase XerD